jgi:hypothetical protein
MQVLALVSAVTSLACAVIVSNEGSAQRSFMASLAAERATQQYLGVQWEAIASELQKLQLAAAPEANSTVASAAQNASKVDVESIIKQVSGSGPVDKMMLAPMLEMLKSMYEDQKKRIADLNQREEKNKKTFEKQKAEHETRMKHIEELHTQHKVSEEFTKNSTESENRMFSYWERVRERNHHMYHVQLKLTHGMMNKAKQMIGAYENALATPNPSKEEAKKALRKVAPEPEIVFLQNQADILSFCEASLKTVNSETAVLAQAMQEVPPMF